MNYFSKTLNDVMLLVKISQSAHAHVTLKYINQKTSSSEMKLLHTAFNYSVLYMSVINDTTKRVLKG